MMNLIEFLIMIFLRSRPVDIFKNNKENENNESILGDANRKSQLQ